MQNILELQPNKISTDLTSYNFLLFSDAGLGKTTWAAKMFPERALILGFEYGFKGIPGVVGVSVPDYLSLLKYVEQLDTDEARAMYDTLIIDTTTKVAEVIEEYIMSQYGKNSVGEAKSHGGAYPLINRYYNLAFNRLKARGYNFVYICHAKTTEIKKGDEVLYKRYDPKMSDRLAGMIVPEVDYTFFLTLDKEGNRIMVTDKTLKNDGKQRTNLPLTMKLDIDTFLEEYRKGILEKAEGQFTSEKAKTTVVESKETQKDYKELVAEIKLLGKSLQEAGKGKEAIQVVNLNLGQDDNGIQRTLDMMNQDNVQVLEVILLELNKLKN